VSLIENPEGASLMALLMGDMIERSLQDPAVREGVRSLRGDVEVRAGRMVVTLRFARSGVSIVTGPSERPRARVEGTLVALLGVALGAGVIGPFLAGAIKVGGNPFVLLRVLPLIRARRKG